MGYFMDMTDELHHHGILGMKWGIRRYQNKDGSLTPLGKKHWEKLSDDAIEKEKKRITLSGDLEEAKKHIDYFNSNEINELVNRKLAIDKLDDATISKGAKFVDKTIKVGKKAAELVGTAADMMGKGTDAYNKYVKISNSLFDTNLKEIKNKEDKPKKLSIDKIKNTDFDKLSKDEMKEISEYLKARETAENKLKNRP